MEKLIEDSDLVPESQAQVSVVYRDSAYVCVTCVLMCSTLHPPSADASWFWWYVFSGILWARREQQIGWVFYTRHLRVRRMQGVWLGMSRSSGYGLGCIGTGCVVLGVVTLCGGQPMQGATSQKTEGH